MRVSAPVVRPAAAVHHSPSPRKRLEHVEEVRRPLPVLLQEQDLQDNDRMSLRTDMASARQLEVDRHQQEVTRAHEINDFRLNRERAMEEFQQQLEVGRKEQPVLYTPMSPKARSPSPPSNRSPPKPPLEAVPTTPLNHVWAPITRQVVRVDMAREAAKEDEIHEQERAEMREARQGLYAYTQTVHGEQTHRHDAIQEFAVERDIAWRKFQEELAQQVSPTLNATPLRINSFQTKASPRSSPRAPPPSAARPAPVAATPPRISSANSATGSPRRALGSLVMTL
eukprot:NODE_746_length_1374_cov_53.409057_g548_i0.p1 GENE.NODE_746_length_1374_cov_53.409057_g548_i0~~NODE_746_length_1374_cov_53.409057_g548_i0.p1  ORF type:complete len:283 (-),score=46.77 NODE_746_length_1374_cov_53.409057_g548_i0:446-1294(-)